MKRFAILSVLVMLLACSVPAMSQQTIDNFYVTVGPGVVMSGGGSGYNGGEWYGYPSMWINQWFYDHPLDFSKGKIVHIEFDWTAMDPLCMTDITVALNWSTPEWSYLGNGTALPPLPGVDEALYIVRVPFVDICAVVPDVQHVAFDYVIYDYNPEWVSLDVRGCNLVITKGVIVHECAVGNDDTTWGAIKSIVE